MKLLLISPKQAYTTMRLQEEAANQNIQLIVKDVRELIDLNYSVDPANFDALYIRQGYVDFERAAAAAHLQGLIGLARRFSEAGKVVVDNSVAEGDFGAGKYYALTRLREQGIAVPQTNLLSSLSITDINYPAIAKWNFGSGAKHTYLLKNFDDLKKVQDKYPAKEIIIQEFIPADFEYKVITVGFKSLPTVIKLNTNSNKFLPDLASHQVVPTSQVAEVVSLAEKASHILRRELAKVDVLESNGRLYLLEVNRWPGFRYFEEVTQLNVAEGFIKYIQKKSRQAIYLS
jgi:glutathione synthase/RimK-type ligase-like ATP-grasp enzyme